MVITRFAPSPTGYLHIGGARTALFAWAWARKNGGKFLLRIEDTDQERSISKHSEAIIEALNWLSISWDDSPIYQSHHRKRHQAIVENLLDCGLAYRCYASPEELAQMRQQQLARGEKLGYDRRWRESKKKPPLGIAPAIRFKMPLEGQASFQDAIKGNLSISNLELDDFIIQRSDGLPTYNLAVVADDLDMEVSHIIRGDDHVMNTYRQCHLFSALSTQQPVFAHLPMLLATVYDEQGAPVLDAQGNVRFERMSKRNAAVDIMQYKKEGYLPDALCNYLSRMSWSHNDAEYFNRDFLLEHFTLEAVLQSPARFDIEKLRWLNRKYIRSQSFSHLRQLLNMGEKVSDEAFSLVLPRVSTLVELKAECAYFETPPDFSKDLLAEHLQVHHEEAFSALLNALKALVEWSSASIKGAIKEVTSQYQLKFKDLGMPLRILLTGRVDTPDIASVLVVLGRESFWQRVSRRLENSQTGND